MFDRKARILLQELKKAIESNLNQEEIFNLIKKLQEELKQPQYFDVEDLYFNTKLQLNLDVLSEQDSPGSIYDIEGLRHHIIIEEKNREAFLDELTQDYRKMIDSLLEEYEDD